MNVRSAISRDGGDAVVIRSSFRVTVVMLWSLEMVFCVAAVMLWSLEVVFA